MRKILLVFCVIIILVTGVSCTLSRPEITQETLIGSAQIIEGYEEIEDAEVIIEEDKITFYLVPTKEQEVSKERLRELGLDFLKVLSGFTVNDELSGPTDESYGEIYNYYDVEIIVEGERGATLDKGTKDKNEDEVQWQQ